MFVKRFGIIFRTWNKIPGGHPIHWFSSSNHVYVKEGYDLLSAICLERRPVITTELTDIEIKFQRLIHDIEYENSYKSDNEVRKEKERKQAELLKKGELGIDEDIAIKTAQDLDDAYQEEFSKFQCAERSTEADKKKDLKSLDRALDKYLVLLVNQKIGNDYKWVLPQGLRENGETMRQAAERVLLERCGANLQVKFLGNAPCGFYKYKYPTAVRGNSASKAVGAKVFFFKAWHLGGSVDCSKILLKDFKWSCTEDLSSTLQNDAYYNSLSQFLIAQ